MNLMISAKQFFSKRAYRKMLQYPKYIEFSASCWVCQADILYYNMDCFYHMQWVYWLDNNHDI